MEIVVFGDGKSKLALMQALSALKITIVLVSFSRSSDIVYVCVHFYF